MTARGEFSGSLNEEPGPGAEVVGGVVVVRYGDNPLAAIKNVKKKIAEIKRYCGLGEGEMLTGCLDPYHQEE